ncbi:hypothetical protein HCA53_12940 [Listeria innocua]|uniref:hypothetical protein n=1 Tax=Listeria innocua TaxID=1642 RepID=UPI00162AAEDF|nr:hypothetical protein [Listeria innocua]MBC1910664.1 hypothetical protein [Listeria innocua]MBC1928920.1 hypothetical protein [Listeria innocua]
MESVKVSVSLNRELGSEPPKVSLIFEDSYSFPEIILSDEATNDLKNFFDAIFNYIINNEEMIEFQLNDNGTDMFKEVADDIINQLNSEIRLSEENFNEFLELMKQ